MAVRMHVRLLSTAAQGSKVARSLHEAFVHRATAESLLLARSEDVRCINLMCAKVGLGCACRIALSLERMPELRLVDLAGNALPDLPDSLTRLPQLTELYLQDNGLTSLDVLTRALSPDRAKAAGQDTASGDSAVVEPFGQLQVLDLRRNAFSKVLAEPPAVPSTVPSRGPVPGLPLYDLERLPRLRTVLLEGNPCLADPAEVAKLRASRLARDGVFQDL